MAPTIRVVVASAHDATRAGVRQALEEHGLAVCGEAVEAVGAVEVVKRSGSDCCLLGVNLPGDALAAVAQIRIKSPQAARLSSDRQSSAAKGVVPAVAARRATRAVAQPPS